MNLPAAVIAAMAICNQHVVATQGNYTIYSGSSGTNWCYSGGSCSEQESSEQESSSVKKLREDATTTYKFNLAYAWEPEYHNKCKIIQSYVEKVRAAEAKKADAKEAARKAAEQSTLDKGIVELVKIKP